MLVMATRKGKGTRERGAESCERSDSKGGDPPLAPSRRDTPRRWFLWRCVCQHRRWEDTGQLSPCAKAWGHPWMQKAQRFLDITRG